MNTIARLAAATALAVSLAGPALAQDATLSQAKAMLDRRDAQAAFRLLKPLEADRAGDPAFDYLLGVAALDAGRTTDAILALERVLAVQPGNVQARAEIARAYYQAGENQTAKREFEAVRNQGVPAAVQANIDRFLEAIERGAAADRTSLTGYLEAVFGHDSNVNSGVATGQVAVPALGITVPLDQTALKRSDEFFTLGGGLNLRHPLGQGLTLIGTLAGNQRLNFSANQFDTGALDASVGVNLLRGPHSFTVALQGGLFYLDYARYREVYGLLGQWQYILSPSSQLTVFGQLLDVSYPGPNQSVRDVNRHVLGVGYAHALSAQGAVAFGSLYVGKEDPKAGGNPHLGHDVYGLRGGVQWPLRDDLSLFLTGSYERRDYGGAVPGFVDARNDEQYGLTLGAQFSPWRKWRITPQISLTDNQSNTSIYDHRREIYSISVRREF